MGKELFLVLPRKSSLSSTAQAHQNLNAYNVLKQGTIAKADDYAGYVFHTRIIYHIDRKPVAYHANKKAAHAH
ncbi:hypothetical protein MJ390_06810 [Klebsiella pneumoniae]|nr:hypothetical protein MJ390_06810 [Klebsiella pneumoniae]